MTSMTDAFFPLHGAHHKVFFFDTRLGERINGGNAHVERAGAGLAEIPLARVSK